MQLAERAGSDYHRPDVGSIIRLGLLSRPHLCAGGARHLRRHIQLELRGLARSDLHRVALRVSWAIREVALRRKLPPRVCGDIQDGLFRWRLLHVLWRGKM